MSSLIIFILTLLFLVLIHEAGHYGMARLFGVAIEEFSIGFGRACWSYTNQARHTKFKISPILLGGYVKFYEEQAPDAAGVLYQDLGFGKKILILLAGPCINLIFGFLALIFFFKLSSYHLLPLIGEVTLPNQYGFQTGQQIISVNHQAVHSWEDVAAYIGTSANNLAIELRTASGHIEKLDIPARPGLQDDLFAYLGFKPFIPSLPPIIAKIDPGSLAAKAGLQQGDKVLSINQVAIKSFLDIVQLLKQHPQEPLLIEFQRQDKTYTTRIELNNNQGLFRQGRLGIYADSVVHYPQWFYYQVNTWSNACQKAALYFVNLCLSQLKLWFNLSSEIKHLSSPVGIAKVANQAWQIGVKTYLQFVVWLSISLGLINLLPIPILDGGQCIVVILQHFFPNFLNLRRQRYLMIWSLFFLFGLFTIGLANDLSF